MSVKKDRDNKYRKADKEKNTTKKKSLKREESISKQIEQPTKIKRTPFERLKSGAFSGVLLTIIFAIALYIRAALPYKSVFLPDGTIRFGGNDPWYHIRIVEYILYNYPHTLTYDAFTQFPYGRFQHYGPLYDHAIAFISFVFGEASPPLFSSLHF